MVGGLLPKRMSASALYQQLESLCQSESGEKINLKGWNKKYWEKVALVGNCALVEGQTVCEGIEKWVQEMHNELENQEIQLKHETLKLETCYCEMGKMVEELGQKVSIICSQFLTGCTDCYNRLIYTQPLMVLRSLPLS